MHVTEIKKSLVNVSTKCASSRSELCKQLLSKTCNINYKIKRSNFTLWVSRNLLISLEIRSLLSSSISIVLMSSWRKTNRKEKVTFLVPRQQEWISEERKQKLVYLFLFLLFSLSSLGVFILWRCVEFSSIFPHQSIDRTFNNLILLLCLLV